MHRIWSLKPEVKQEPLGLASFTEPFIHSGCIYVPACRCTFFVMLGWGSSSAWARYGGEHSPKLESFPVLIRLSFEEHNWRGVWQPRKAGHLSPRSLAKIQAALAKRRLGMKPLVLTTHGGHCTYLQYGTMVPVLCLVGAIIQ